MSERSIPSRIVRATAQRAVRLTMLGMRRGPHLSRFTMYRELTKAPVAADGRTLSVSGSERLCALLGLKDVFPANFPEYDLRSLPFPDESFDCVVSDQVIEHVEGDPFLAVEETRRVLKAGGVAVHTSCLIYPIHNDGGMMGDLWRFTPEGLAFLCRNFSEVVEVGGWGNQFVPLLDWLGLSFDPVPLSRLHPLNLLATMNDARWPVVTWVVARK